MSLFDIVSTLFGLFIVILIYYIAFEQKLQNKEVESPESERENQIHYDKDQYLLRVITYRDRLKKVEKEIQMMIDHEMRRCKTHLKYGQREMAKFVLRNRKHQRSLLESVKNRLVAINEWIYIIYIDPKELELEFIRTMETKLYEIERFRKSVNERLTEKARYLDRGYDVQKELASIERIITAVARAKGSQPPERQ